MSKKTSRFYEIFEERAVYQKALKYLDAHLGLAAELSAQLDDEQEMDLTVQQIVFEATGAQPSEEEFENFEDREEAINHLGDVVHDLTDIKTLIEKLSERGSLQDVFNLIPGLEIKINGLPTDSAQPALAETDKAKAYAKQSGSEKLMTLVEIYKKYLYSVPVTDGKAPETPAMNDSTVRILGHVARQASENIKSVKKAYPTLKRLRKGTDFNYI